MFVALILFNSEVKITMKNYSFFALLCAQFFQEKNKNKNQVGEIKTTQIENWPKEFEFRMQFGFIITVRFEMKHYRNHHFALHLVDQGRLLVLMDEIELENKLVMSEI